MRIRPHQPGDDEVQAQIFNTAAGTFPAFKPAVVDEIVRRHRADDSGAGGRFYATDDASDAVVGYASFNLSGRVSYPWCLAGFEGAQPLLLEAVLSTMASLNIPEAWTAYRGDWLPVLGFFREHGFEPKREMVNFAAEVSSLPTTPIPAGLTVGPMTPDDIPALMTLGHGLFDDASPDALGNYFWKNRWFGPENLFTLREDGRGQELVAAGVVITDATYADPTKIDAKMPCFRLGTLGTESERHKRVNGLVSCVFASDAAGEAVLAEAGRRLMATGLTHVAAQAPSDHPPQVRLFDRYFARQGAFPILSRRLS
jgi:hypothetical protein